MAAKPQTINKDDRNPSDTLLVKLFETSTESVANLLTSSPALF
jgi:hypothetical protein